ncbi:MAG: Ldh family oxidoreductase [Candidatus Poribacteria bacterium]|nr:Ldh family oxidoreductase [Candidatus Poribacteria bacterium]
MVIKTAGELDKLIRDVLTAAGADERNANRVAEALVSSSMRGVDTHGILHLPSYVEKIQAGEIVPTAWPEILQEDTTSALIGGNWTFGHVTAKYAMDIAIKKAEAHNVAIVSMVQVNHIGRLGEYAEMAAAKGMLSVVWAGGFGEEKPVAVPYGGRQPVLSTNPIGMGFPVGDGPPMVIDYATTTVAGSKVMTAKDRNIPLPAGSVVDKDGVPSTDPDAFIDGGALLPFGAHKGYALMLAVEFFGRILSGADGFSDEEKRGGPTFRHSGVSLLVVKADLFQAATVYSKRAEELANRVRSVPPAPGFESVLIPGDLEARAEATRTRDGIPIPNPLWQRLTALADSLDVNIGV